jgi:2,3,4,5-tetrahydropyridine-2-carboxylate N-succinyltransferase
MKSYIEQLWEVRDTLSKSSLKEAEIKKAILDAIDALDNGKIRLIYKENIDWKMNAWIKKAIILYIKVSKNYMITNGTHKFYDNVSSKFDSWDHEKFENAGIKILPGTTVKKGAYIAKGSIIKSSFIETGVFIDENSLIEYNSVLGIGVQVGKNCHIESFVGIEGNLSIHTMPTIIEDNVYIGAKSQIGNGVIIKEGSILAMGCLIDQYTPIIDSETNQVYYGQIPPYSVVKPAYKDGKYVCIISQRVDKIKKQELTIAEILKD